MDHQTPLKMSLLNWNHRLTLSGDFLPLKQQSKQAPNEMIWLILFENHMHAYKFFWLR